MNAVNTPEEMLAFLATLQPSSEEPEALSVVEPDPAPELPAPADVDETVAAIIASMAQEAPSPAPEPELSEEQIIEHLAAIQEESVLEALKEINTDALKRSIYEARGVVGDAPEPTPSEGAPEPPQVAVDAVTTSKAPRKRTPKKTPSQAQPKKTGLALDDVSLNALTTIVDGNKEKLLLLEGQSLDVNGNLPNVVLDVLDSLPSLAKKQREAAHNIFEWMAGTNDLRNYTQIAIDALIAKHPNNLTRADLMAAYIARGLMPGTAQVQVSKYFSLMLKLEMAFGNTDGSIGFYPPSLIAQKRQAEM